MLLTISRYADPSGVAFLKESPGIIPTVEAKAVVAEEILPEDNEAEEDDQAKVESPQLPIEKPTADDVQLKKALEVLKSNGQTTTAKDEKAVKPSETPVHHKSASAGSSL